MAWKCLNCESRKAMMRFENESFVVEHAGMTTTVKGLSGWRCVACGEVEFEAESTRSSDCEFGRGDLEGFRCFANASMLRTYNLSACKPSYYGLFGLGSFLNENLAICRVSEDIADEVRFDGVEIVVTGLGPRGRIYD